MQRPSKYHSNKQNCHENNSSNFETIERDDNVFKKTNSLYISKTSQNSDVPTKIVKENAEFLTNFTHSALNEAIQSGSFPFSLKWADVTPIFITFIFTIINLSTLFQMYQIYLKDLYFNKCFNFLIKCFRCINAVSENLSIHNTALKQC